MSKKYEFTLPEKQICNALMKMFPDGGETYTREDVKRIFEEEGVDISNFDDILSQCVSGGWITDCGNNLYTR